MTKFIARLYRYAKIAGVGLIKPRVSAFGLALLLLFFGASKSWALFHETAQITFPDISVNSKVHGLRFDSTEVTVNVDQEGLIPKVTALIVGRYERQNWKLSWNGQDVVDARHPLNRNSVDYAKFVLRIRLYGKRTPVMLIATGPQGEIEKQPIMIQYEHFDGPPDRPVIVPGLSYTSIHYTETYQPAFTETVLTGKLLYQRPLPWPYWYIGVSLYGTVQPLSSNIPNVTAYFVGANLRAGYVFPAIHNPWRLMIMAGAYYSKMFVSGGATFGYNAAIYPHLFPVLRRELGLDDSFSLYGKYTPVGSGSSFFSLSQTEWALGGIYEHVMSNGHGLSLNLDYSNLHFKPRDVVTIDLTTVSFGLGYGL